MHKAPFWLAAALPLSLAAAACAPQNSAVDGAAADFSQQWRDLGSCDPLPQNLLGNPGFEEPSPSQPDGNGQASSTGNPPSSIPGNALGPWDGCCSQRLGSTTWTVGTARARCGLRAVTVAADQALASVLSQRLDLAGYGGRGVRATAWAQLTQAASGGELALDLFDLTTRQVVASSLGLPATGDFRLLVVQGQVPTGGALQLRLSSTGTLEAIVDDTALSLQ